MSIYSGFPTRRDEEKYNGLLSKLILTLQGHLMEFIGETVPHAKLVTYSRIISKMKDFEEHKYLPPKFSELLEPLCKAIGITASIDQKVTQLTENEDYSNNIQRTKMPTQSLQKYRVKSHYQSADVQDNQAKNRAESLIQTKNSCNDPSLIKRSHFQSSHELKERKFNYNALPPKEHQRLKSSQQFDDSVQQTEKWTTLGQTKTTKGALVSKLKSNLRYRAFHPFLQTQENLKKNEKPSRQIIQKRLKTSQSHLQ